jgi:hypothetical protein
MRVSVILVGTAVQYPALCQTRILDGIAPCCFGLSTRTVQAHCRRVRYLPPRASLKPYRCVRPSPTPSIFNFTKLSSWGLLLFPIDNAGHRRGPSYWKCLQQRSVSEPRGRIREMRLRSVLSYSTRAPEASSDQAAIAITLDSSDFFVDCSSP